MGIVFTMTQAMEETIPIHVHNDRWPEKTRLVGIVTYKHNKPSAEFNLILEGVSEESSRATTHLSVPKGLVKCVQLLLTNYYEEATRNNLEETLLAGLNFTPIPSSLLEISFTIRERIIVEEAIYLLPPRFLE